MSSSDKVNIIINLIVLGLTTALFFATVLFKNKK